MEKGSKIEILSGVTFIVFGEDYQRHPHALEHIMRPLFPYNNFIWVETIGLRIPKFNWYDTKRILEKFKNWLGPKIITKLNNSQITISRPFMLPYNNISLVNNFNKWSVKRNVSKVLKNLKSKKIIFITSVPHACDFVKMFKEDLSIYFCVDEFSKWPGMNYTYVQQLEDALLKKVNYVICTARELQLSKSKYQKDAQLITHGVDVSHFKLPPKKIDPNNLNICYFGLFDERTNQNIISNIAKSLPMTTIHIIGRRVASITELKQYKNIHWHPPVSYEKLPNAIEQMDIFILPYHKNELTQYINPLKLKEYLSTGRFVIASALPEVVKLEEHLFVASCPHDFVNVIKDIISGKKQNNSEQTIKFLASNETWSSKAKDLSQLIQNKLSTQSNFQ